MYAKSTKIMEREARRSNRAPQARSNLRSKRVARDENVPAKRADFFHYQKQNKFIYIRFYLPYHFPNFENKFLCFFDVNM